MKIKGKRKFKNVHVKENKNEKTATVKVCTTLS